MTTPCRRSTHSPRSRRHRLALALGPLAFLIAIGTVGCDQGEGERCQTQDDCASPLVCNLATLTCSGKNTSGQIDATIADGPPPDAAPPDAAIDATDAPPGSSIDSPTIR